MKNKTLVVSLLVAVAVIGIAAAGVFLFKSKSSGDSADGKKGSITVDNASKVPVNDQKRYIQMVKDGHPIDYTNNTYGQAFEKYFTSPAWKYVGTEKGKEVVEFSGSCNYEGTKVKARQQLLLNLTSKEVTLGQLYFNDEAQTNITRAQLIRTIFGGEAKKQGESSTGKKNPSSDDSLKQPIYTGDNAITLVINYINQGGKVPGKLEVTAEDKVSFTVHALKGSGEKGAAEGWYKVMKANGEVQDLR